MHDMGFGLGFLNFLGTVLFWVLLFLVIRYLVRGGRPGRGCRSKLDRWREGRAWQAQPDEAEQVARERLAKGEINEEEFGRIKSGLGGAAQNAKTRPDSHPLRWLKGDGALETARLRLARGEITPDEFETIRRALAS